MLNSLVVNHVEGDCIIGVEDRTVTIIDTFTDVQDSVVFKDPEDAYRFIAEYLTNWEAPTEEFRKLFPNHC